mmetsp:Transcript_32862/g.60133  ORF Transcript_32862/g.60133 Transcript_32862/m.60133 type:complete len:569 (-) Transcript_32862:61-1767(-)
MLQPPWELCREGYWLCRFWADTRHVLLQQSPEATELHRKKYQPLASKGEDSTTGRPAALLRPCLAEAAAEDSDFLKLEFHEALQAGQVAPLSLSSHPGRGLVVLHGIHGQEGATYNLCLGDASDALQVEYRESSLCLAAESRNRLTQPEFGSLIFTAVAGEGMETKQFKIGDDGRVSQEGCYVVVQDGTQLRTDNLFLARLACRIILLGLCNAPFGPLFFWMAFRGSLTAVLVGYCLHILVGLIMQRQLVLSVEEWLHRGQDLACWRTAGEQMTKMRQWKYLGCLPICMSNLLYMMLLSLPEWIDLDQDCATAGQSYASWHGTPAERFRASWEHIPLLGRVIGELGLPGILVSLLAFSSYSSIGLFLTVSSSLLYLSLLSDVHGLGSEARGSNNRYIIWNRMTHVADSGGMQVLGFVAYEFQVATCTEAGVGADGIQEKFADRSVRFVTRIACEAAPQLWFQISLLGLLVDGLQPKAHLIMLCSIASSMWTILQGLSTSLPELMHKLSMWRQRGEAWARWKVLCYQGPAVVLAIVLLLCSCIRLVGVYYCPEHVFNILEGGCHKFTDA